MCGRATRGPWTTWCLQTDRLNAFTREALTRCFPSPRHESIGVYATPLPPSTLWGGTVAVGGGAEVRYHGERHSNRILMLTSGTQSNVWHKVQCIGAKIPSSRSSVIADVMIFRASRTRAAAQSKSAVRGAPVAEGVVVLHRHRQRHAQPPRRLAHRRHAVRRFVAQAPVPHLAGLDQRTYRLQPDRSMLTAGLQRLVAYLGALPGSGLVELVNFILLQFMACSSRGTVHARRLHALTSAQYRCVHAQWHKPASGAPRALRNICTARGHHQHT